MKPFPSRGPAGTGGTPTDIVIADITDRGAIGAELMAAESEAEAQAALGVTSGPGSRIAPTFELGQGWTLVAASTPADGAATLALDGAAPVGRITLSTSGNVHDLAGPRIERALPPCGVFKMSVRLRSSSITGDGYIGLYLRDAAGSNFLTLFALPNGSIAGNGPGWAITGPGSAGEVSFNATCFLCLRGVNNANLRSGTINGSGAWTIRTNANLGYIPSHIGICGLADATSPASGSFDVDTFVLETVG